MYIITKFMPKRGYSIVNLVLHMIIRYDHIQYGMIIHITL